MHCGGCVHPNRDQLDAQLVAGVPYRSLEPVYDLSIATISRHAGHVRQMIRELQPAERQEHAGALLERVGRLADRAEALLTIAESKENIVGATGAINACARVRELIGKLTGELSSGSGIHLSVTNNRTTNNIVNVQEDTDLALAVAEATRNFDPAEIQRLRLLVSAGSGPVQDI